MSRNKTISGVERASIAAIKVVPVVAGLGAIFISSLSARAVPISFLLQEPANQKDVTWQTVESGRFRVYHDEKAENLGRFGLSSLEAAWPFYRTLFSLRLPAEKPLSAARAPEVVSRFGVIPAIINSRVDVGGFANPATQSIEVQIKSGDNAALFQHELAHRAMYERLDPKLGPAGRGFVLAMVPTWWIEGTAEYLTESLGRLTTEGLIRFQALENYWPTWDSLHNLYSGGGDYGRGYATSGRFFGFLMDRAGGRSLGQVQDEFFWKGVTPPFVTASENVMSSIWQKSGQELYDEFRGRVTTQVKDELDGMPQLSSTGVKSKYLAASGMMRSRIFGDKIVTPELNVHPYPSALILTDIVGRKSTRHVVNAQGGAVSDVESFDPQGTAKVWSAKSELFGNGVRGDHLLYISMEILSKGLPVGSQDSVYEMKVSSEQDPFEILQIEARGKSRAFVLGNLRGDWQVFFADAAKGQLTRLRQWSAGTSVRFVRKTEFAKGDDRRDCIRLIVGNEGERTSVERLCTDGTLTTILPEGRYLIRDGIESSEGMMTLLAGWGKVLGLLRIQSDELVGGFPFPDWVGGIFPWGGDGDTIGAWLFKGDGYRLTSLSWKRALAAYRDWAADLGDDSPWRSIPRWQIYQPPFVKLALREVELARKQETLFDNEVKSTKREQEELLESANAKRAVQKTDAPQQFDHFFTYPWASPSIPLMSGLNLGLASVPFQDEMERQSLRLFAQYNMPSGIYSLNASYLNNRWFEGFVFDLFSQARFNGYYYWNKSAKKDSTWKLSRYPAENGTSFRWENYLREDGVQVSTVHKLWPSSVVLAPFIKVASIEPAGPIPDKREVAFLGAQNLMLGTVGFSLSSSLGERAFYAGNIEEIGEPYLLWSNRGALYAEANRTFGKAYDYLGNESPSVSFERYRLNVSSTLSYDEQSLALRGALGLTTGSHPFNFREYYEPYKTYLLGSGSGLNNLNYFIVSNQVFGRLVGTHSFGTSLAYAFPLVSEVDKQLSILYFSTLRGEAVVNYGGVSRDESFRDIRSIAAASFAARATLDIKGVQIFPSIACGNAFGTSAWVLFSEIAFSEFF
jgi:hypothetical protein